MRTEELAALLARQAEPIDAAAGARRYALALGAALALALALTGLALGLNPSLSADAARPMFWVKEAFCLALSVAATAAVARLARPGASPAGPAKVIGAALLAMWVLAAIVLVQAAPGERAALLLGRTALVCPFLIAMVATPVLVAFFWLLRGAAPTRLRLAGASGGFAAGAIGALVYSLHCPEFAAPFLGVWYVLGMLITALAGAIAGPRLLRW